LGKFFKKFDERTPSERATFEKNRVGLRIVICGYIIYLGIKVIVDTSKDSSGMNPVIAYIVAGLLIAAAVVLLVMAFVQLSKSVKNKEFDKLTYYKQQFGDDFTEEDMYRYEESLEKGEVPDIFQKNTDEVSDENEQYEVIDESTESEEDNDLTESDQTEKTQEDI